MRQIPMRLTRLAVLVLVAALLSGCGKKAVDPIEMYKQAALKTGAAKTWRQITTVTTPMGAAEFRVVVDMITDASADVVAAGSLSMIVSGEAEGLRFEAYTVNRRVYLKAPGVNKYAIFPIDISGAQLTPNAEHVAQTLSGRVKPTASAASFEVNGGQVNGSKLTFAFDSAKLRALQASQPQGTGPDTLPLIVYLDADGYLARTEGELPANQSGLGPTVKLVAEMFDYGKQVDVLIPDITAENTITFGQLLALVRPR